MNGTFYTQSEYKTLENKLKREEAKNAKKDALIKSLKAEVKRLKAEADNLSTIVFDKPEELPQDFNAPIEDTLQLSRNKVTLQATLSLYEEDKLVNNLTASNETR